jgi:hypothetical protein
VKKCKNTHTGTLYATKIVRTTDEEMILRIKQEFEMMKGLSHLNLLKIEDSVQNVMQNEHHTIMEHVEG